MNKGKDIRQICRFLRSYHTNSVGVSNLQWNVPYSKSKEAFDLEQKIRNAMTDLTILLDESKIKGLSFKRKSRKKFRSKRKVGKRKKCRK